MHYINNIFLISTSLLLFSCSTNDLTHKKSDIPDWYLEVPTSEEFLYGIGEADGPDLGLTRISAEAAARDDIVRQISVKVGNMVRNTKQKVGLGKGQSSNVSEAATTQVASQTIMDSKIIKKHIETSNGIYKIFVLAQISVESVKNGLQEKIKDEDVKRQLEINDELQNILSQEIAKMDGSR